MAETNARASIQKDLKILKKRTNKDRSKNSCEAPHWGRTAPHISNWLSSNSAKKDLGYGGCLVDCELTGCSHCKQTMTSSFHLLLSVAGPTPGTACPQKDMENPKRVQQKAPRQ